MLTQSSPQFHTVSYRNGIYQGNFSKQTQTRQSFGLVFTTDNHLIMGSNWLNDQANEATFVFYNHGCYVYGFWNNSVPHGFNAVRMDKIVIFAFYDRGIVDGRMLMIYEQYNTAIVLERGETQGQFIQIQKGEIYSDEDFNQYAQVCKWPQFDQNWKTLIKFISANMIHDKGPKSQMVKLRLINGTCYRYGYDEGIAIVFDDEYRIISAGLHRKANLKSLGVRFTKESFVQEGNFSSQSQVLAFNFGHRPDNKMGKIYTNYLLKSNEFVNKFLTNPANILITNLQELVKSNLFRKLLAGQITTRKLDISYGTPQSSDRKQLQGSSSNKKNKDQFYQELEEQKKRLEIYKKQLNDSINKRSRVAERQLTDQQGLDKEKKSSNRIIHKEPVQLASRTQYNNEKNHRSKSKNNRSPIFTPDKNQTREISPSRVSPFGQKMRNRIFKDDQTSQKKPKKYVYEPIQQLYPKHTDVSPIRNNVSIQNYNSPHEQLHLSNQKMGVSDGISAVVPVLMRNQKSEDVRQSDRIKNNNREDSTKQRINQPVISFREPNLITYSNNKTQQKQLTNDIPPNIVINNPNKSKSPVTRKQFAAQALQFQAKNKKNDIYFKDTVIESTSQQSNKKQIKGNTYLQKYKRAKQNTPEKASISPDVTRYNKTIKGFNQNNKIYEKIQSPPKHYQQYKYNPPRQNNSNQRNQRLDRNQVQRKSTNVDPYQYKQDIGIGKGTHKNLVNQTTPTRKKYQYVFN